MVSLLLVSHSSKIVEGLKELLLEMAGEIKIGIVGGTADGRLGSDYEKTYNVLKEVYCDDGVLILFDIGSSYMTAEMAVETLIDEGLSNIKFLDIPLVEGSLVAAVECSMNKTIDEIVESTNGLKINKIQ